MCPKNESINLFPNNSIAIPIIDGFYFGYYVCLLADILYSKQKVSSEFKNESFSFFNLLFSNDIINTFILGLEKDFSILINIELLRNLFLNQNFYLTLQLNHHFRLNEFFVDLNYLHKMYFF